MFLRLLAMSLLTSLSIPAMAGDAASSPPRAALPRQQASPPQEKPAEAGSVPANAKTAAKLAGLVAFVANSCPELMPDYARFKNIVSALGIDVDDLSNGDLKLQYLNYASLYQADVKGNCEQARSRFGETGTTFQGLFQKK